jgi:hypothetical protein
LFTYRENRRSAGDRTARRTGGQDCARRAAFSEMILRAKLPVSRNCLYMPLRD